MANVSRLAQKEKTAVHAWLKLYMICLLPFPAAESTAQRCKMLTFLISLRQAMSNFSIHA